MLEARAICSGATGRNGGHCKDVSFKTYSKLKTQLGREAAMQLVKFRRSHVDATRQLAHQLSKEGFSDGQFRDVTSLTAVFDQDTFRDFRANLEALLEDFPEERSRYTVSDGEEAQKVRFDLSHAVILTVLELMYEQKYGFLGASGVIASPAAALWPYRLITGILQRLLWKHQTFSLEALTPVSSVTTSNDLSRPYLVHTSRGIIRAQHVVHCTNGYASHLLPALRDKVVPVRGQMTAITPSNSFPRLGHANSWSLCWDNGGFDYMTQAGNAEGLVFLGGGLAQGSEAGVVDLDSVDDTKLNKPALKHLCSVLPDRFRDGSGATLKQAWTGIMGFTADGFPLVGKIPYDLSNREVVEGASGHEWIAAGFSGYGMVNCWQSGRAVADMISGQPTGANDESFPNELFECSRKRLESMNIDDLWSAFGPPSTKSRL